MSIRIGDYLAYDPATGDLWWKQARGHRKQGDHCECTDACGYVVIRFNNTLEKGHRIAWFLMTGEWPEEGIDHINGDPGDNRWINLRTVTHMENCHNQKQRYDNTSGCTGVRWDKARDKWLVQIKVDYLSRYLGRYDSFEDACAARKAAEIKYGFHRNHGRIE